MPANSGTRRRSERTEKTVVIRDRRQVEELRRQMAQHKERLAPRASSNKGLVLWVIVGLAAFLTGGLVALFATQDVSETPAQAGPLPSAAPAPKAAPTNTSEPPSVSIDELPIEPK
ncbi:MAG: hypothetical protein K0R38_3163 [Polyangiaceae bacterium]|jgi:hypothetical protein|nr:hypothetical protein [Polyangiaceae bacterium]